MPVQRTAARIGIALSIALAIGALLRVAFNTPDPVTPSINTLTLSDGVEIAYVRSGSGQPFVAIHGSPGSKNDYVGLLPILASEYDAIALDMPGFGDSSKWVGNYGYVAAADRVAEVVRALQLEEVVITGFSWGGGVAIAFAARYPELTDRLLLIGGVGVQDGFHTGRYWSELVRYVAAAPTLFLYPGPVGGGLIPFAERFGFWRGFLDGNTREIERLLPEITDPAVIVHGDSDSVVGVESALRHDELLPNSTLHFYEGGHGWIYREFDPLMAEIREAMERSRREYD